MPIPHSETRCSRTGRTPWQSSSVLPMLLFFFLGTSRTHDINRFDIKSVFPGPKAASQQISRTNFHLLRPECAPTPPKPGLSLAKQFPLRGAARPLPAPRLPGSIHLIPHSLPPSFSKGHFVDPYANALAKLRCVPKLSTPPPAGLAAPPTLTTHKEPLRTEYPTSAAASSSPCSRVPLLALTVDV